MGAVKRAIDERAGAKALSGPPPLAPWAAGVLAMPARYLFELPLPPTIALLIHGVGGIVRVGVADPEVSEDDTSDADASDLWLSPAEWAALIMGVEADRVWSAHARALLARKRDEPSFVITPEIALDGAQADPDQRWTLARALDRLGGELLSAER